MWVFEVICASYSGLLTLLMVCKTMFYPYVFSTIWKCYKLKIFLCGIVSTLLMEHHMDIECYVNIVLQKWAFPTTHHLQTCKNLHLPSILNLVATQWLVLSPSCLVLPYHHKVGTPLYQCYLSAFTILLQDVQGLVPCSCKIGIETIQIVLI